MRGSGDLIGITSNKPHPLTNFEIINKLSYIPSFKGVFMKDQLPSNIHMNGTYVVNTDTSDLGGKHWQCIINKTRMKYCIFFDSFGMPSNSAFCIFMKTSGKPIIYNSSKLQGSSAITCGYYVTYICEEIENNTYYDILYKLSQNPTINNENFIFRQFKLKNASKNTE